MPVLHELHGALGSCQHVGLQLQCLKDELSNLLHLKEVALSEDDIRGCFLKVCDLHKDVAHACTFLRPAADELQILNSLNSELEVEVKANRREKDEIQTKAEHHERAASIRIICNALRRAHYQQLTDGPQGSIILATVSSPGLLQLLAMPGFGAFAPQVLRLYRDTVERCIRQHRGYVSRQCGDAYLVAFPNIIRATEWACALQTELLHCDWPPGLLALREYAEVMRDGAPTALLRGPRTQIGMELGTPSTHRCPLTDRTLYADQFIHLVQGLCLSASMGLIALGPELTKQLRAQPFLRVGKVFKSSSSVVIHAGGLAPAGAPSPTPTPVWVMCPTSLEGRLSLQAVAARLKGERPIEVVVHNWWRADPEPQCTLKLREDTYTEQALRLTDEKKRNAEMQEELDAKNAEVRHLQAALQAAQTQNKELLVQIADHKQTAMGPLQSFSRSSSKSPRRPRTSNPLGSPDRRRGQLGPASTRSPECRRTGSVRSSTSSLSRGESEASHGSSEGSFGMKPPLGRPIESPGRWSQPQVPLLRPSSAAMPSPIRPLEGEPLSFTRAVTLPENQTPERPGPDKENTPPGPRGLDLSIPFLESAEPALHQASRLSLGSPKALAPSLASPKALAPCSSARGLGSVSGVPGNVLKDSQLNNRLALGDKSPKKSANRSKSPQAPKKSTAARRVEGPVFQQAPAKSKKQLFEPARLPASSSEGLATPASRSRTPSSLRPLQPGPESPPAFAGPPPPQPLPSIPRGPPPAGLAGQGQGGVLSLDPVGVPLACPGSPTP
uniref:Guanylate cyclase domain-containing protein n=1 Tax=Eutreptiella gymnastica TaxID=73025 RepID=A0A7S1JDE4_9EUGL|mmetsp:Transcript_87897/g.152908  ORF Transcript_87897/g.152908 Transcript_87897/m.152908 type:complete len:784 (+) Transcript_87897:46-2397(+)